MSAIIQARIRARLKNKKINKPLNIRPSVEANKTYLITRLIDEQYVFDAWSFKKIAQHNCDQIFFGCHHQGISFLSLLQLSVTENDLDLFKQKLTRYTFSIHPTTSKSLYNFVIPLDKNINNGTQFNECIKALSTSTKTQLTNNFANTGFTSLQPATEVQQGKTFNIDVFIQKQKAEKTKQKNEIYKRRLEAISQGVYTVKRLSSDAKASQMNAALQNVSRFKFIGYLKAPFNIKQLKNYSTDPSISSIMAKGVGVPDKAIKSLKGVSSSLLFKCVLTGGQAQLFIAENSSEYSGKVTYKIISTGERLSIHEVYARVLTQQSNLNKPTMMCYLLKLLDECGLIIRQELPVSKKASDLTNGEKLVYNGFKQLTELKYCINGQANDPIVFTKTFAAMWCNVSRITATKAVNKLIDWDVIQLADEIKNYAAYTFKQVISRVKEALNDTKQAYREKLHQYSPRKLEALMSLKGNGGNHLIKSVIRRLNEDPPLLEPD